MSDDKNNATEALKKALAAKKAGQQAGPAGSKGGTKGAEKRMQHQASALNKPAFKRASKRG